MRIYKVDGTFLENQTDTEFGWSFNNTSVVQDQSRDKEVNANISKSRLSELQTKEAFMESVDIVEPIKPPIVVKHVKMNIKTEPIVNIINCKMEVEGPPIGKSDHKQVKEMKHMNFTIPLKEDLAKLITPCNTETKALLSVICFAKYKSLIKEEISSELFRTVNFKTTNFKCLIKDRHGSIQEEIIKDIQHYNATKEDNMLSLMMELILADIGCNLEDIVDVDEESTNDRSTVTSDLGTSIQSSNHGRRSSPCKTNHLDMLDRSSVLSSIGLSDEDKSVQSFCEETLDMRLQTAAIRESFEEEEERVNQLIKMTTALRNELNEALYLDDILHLLNGNIEKVKLKKLPFKIFFKDQNSGLEPNFIV